MSPQVVVSFLRWVAIGVLVGGGAVVSAITNGDHWQHGLLKGLGFAIPIWLGALGWGGYDASRAAQVKHEAASGRPITAIRHYDIGYPLLGGYDRLRKP